MNSIILFFIIHIIDLSVNLECPRCHHEINNNSRQEVSAAISQCGDFSSASSCSQSLHVHHGKKKVVVSFEPTADDTLIIPTTARTAINKTIIWFNDNNDDNKVSRYFDIYCSNKKICEEQTIMNIYDQIYKFEYNELWAYLLTRLYTAIDDHAALTCANNDDKPIKCPYGSCLLISQNPFSFHRGCVLNDSVDVNRYGVIVESKTISTVESQSSITYTCNKPMCNNIDMAKQIYNILEDRKTLIYMTTTTTTTTTTTKTTPSTPKLLTTTSVANKNIEVNFILFLFLFFVY